MNAHMRPYQGDDDYWRIRQFLRDVFVLNGRRQISWHVARWDYWRWPGVESWGDGPLEGRVFIWEDGDGQISAVLNPESRGHGFLQVRPGQRSLELELEMLAVAEQHLAAAREDGQRAITIWADARDELRQDALRSRGYTKAADAEHQHCRDLAPPIPDAPLTAGFVIRALGEAAELPARAWSSWKAFHPQSADSEYEALGWQWYLDIQRCPLYRRDLDLVAVAPDGDLAAFTTVWYDDVTRSAYFEPVATAGPFQRRGLGKAIMGEGLRRVKRLGATLAFVTGYSVEANGLYRSLSNLAPELCESWTKRPV